MINLFLRRKLLWQFEADIVRLHLVDKKFKKLGLLD